MMPSAGGLGAVSSIRLRRGYRGRWRAPLAAFPLAGTAYTPKYPPRDAHPEIATPRLAPRGGLGAAPPAIGSGCCGRVPRPVAVSPCGTATCYPPPCSGHMRLPAPLRIPAGADTRPGGAFLCSPFLLGPAPAASPEISQGHPGTAAVAVFWGDDGAAAGAAAPRGAAPAPHAGASPGAPNHLRGTPRQLLRFRPGFPHERGKAQRGGGGPPCQHLPARRGSARRRLPLLLAPRQDLLPPPAHRHCREREREPGHLGAPHLQVAPVAGSVSHQLGRQTGGGCIQGVCEQPWVLAEWGSSLSRRRAQVCAPLQHWNALEGQHEAFRTPTGTCFVRSPGQRRSVWYSPCRDRTMASTYRQTNYAHDKRYCEIGFSAAVTPDGTLVLGAPGGYYFTGLVYSVELDKILRRFLGTSLLWPGSPGRPTEPVFGDYEDGYRGYSVAVGEFDGNPKTREYVVGAPNKSNTRGEVEIFTAGDTLRWLRGIASEQVASYFGHTVAVADVDGDGRDDLLVGAPLYMARRSDGQRSELGRLYVYLGRGQQRLAGPPQTLTGTHPYGRFAAAIASLGDLDKDGFGDVAVGAPQGGDSGSGQVFIFRGQSEGLAPVPTQRLDSPFPGPAAFGFALRGATDLDDNGYADLLVGAYGVAKVAVYQGLPVVVARTQLSVPDGLNPEILNYFLPDSGVHVSRFHVEFCVSVTGQHIPQSIQLEAELQLDRLKPRPSRRVLLLRGHQSSWQEALVVAPGAVPVCRNLTAYLRDKAEFKDKLSPVALSVALTLPREAPGLVLYGDTLVQAQTHIILEDCGDDNLCVPDLHLAADTPSQRLLIGAEAVLSLRANATNAGEGAFEAELRVQLPPGTHYQAARSTIPGQEKLSCNPRKENGTHVVLCELGNPMKAGARITVDMELSVSGLEDVGDAITFHLQLRSKNSPSPSPSKASVTVTVPVEAEAEMELRGNSLPATVVLPTSWHGVEGSRRLEDHGIRVEHVYELHNRGPGTVSGVTLSLTVPHLLGDHVLLYLLELGTEGGMNCSHHPALNPAQLEVSGPTAAAPGNGTHQRERREAEPPPGAGLGNEGLGDLVRVDCDNATCLDITCHVPSLGKDQRALVSIHALLWMDTLQQREHLLTQFRIQSQAWFNISAMPYRVQPRVLPSGKAETETCVVRTSPGGEGAVPVWWVVLGVLAGLLLLTLLIVVMWKMGFFKRTRPPAEGDTQEPGQAQEPGSAQD